MQPLLYRDLVPWYRLVDPYEDHADEAACYQAAFERRVSPRPETLLELGAGAGHNAFHLKRRFRCTLTDISEPMQALSRELHPDCEHILGDMRSLRLGRTFDAVLVADAIMYMLSEADLLSVAHTTYVHTRPGGAALFAPDCIKENFVERTNLIATDEGARSLRGLEWMWDPNPEDDTFTVEYVFAIRDGKEVKTVHDRHVEGIFPLAVWQRVLAEVGFTLETVERPLDEHSTDEVFLCRREPSPSPADQTS